MTKVISLSDAAYEEMKASKNPGESFSDVVLRIIGKVRQRPLEDFFGLWPGTSAEVERIKAILAKDRKKAKTKEVTF